MSGGHFDYKQYYIQDIADSVQEVIENNAVGDYAFSDETIEEFKRGLVFLRLAHVYAQRIDWLISADDGEDSFHARLAEDKEKFGVDHVEY